ncbi:MULTISPECIES: PTS sugar transporter subunit IIA [Lactobacillus]|uniref:Ascorbate-specific PTS system EIIA component n=1 Tax=Lactobacillus kullabergensis TaxID=1218493 RepID=A0ABM6W2Q3_9LACO|nr:MULTISPECIES: PTS sugar transporter subunit IIA [Lactobacillus]AWM76202.1 PTS sugar transporter subunit IIA [Lactobacillus kullabergensis]MBC6370338.1 PTS sugar transporter subunit IIA [Lactobacillus kullabergensis]RMC52809.1 PTS sugar transporter subunit IIA [Lactobacillus sp. ESL0261]
MVYFKNDGGQIIVTCSLFNEDNVQIIDSAMNWKIALQKASEPLLKANIITPKYVASMIESIKKNGPYMVLTDYFALMHARPGDGVNKMGMSLLVSRNPIDLEGKPVKIFLVMAAIDNTSHLQSLQKVISIFMDTESYKTILSANKSAIVSMFKKVKG